MYACGWERGRKKEPNREIERTRQKKGKERERKEGGMDSERDCVCVCLYVCCVCACLHLCVRVHTTHLSCHQWARDRCGVAIVTCQFSCFWPALPFPAPWYRSPASSSVSHELFIGGAVFGTWRRRMCFTHICHEPCIYFKSFRYEPRTLTLLFPAPWYRSPSSSGGKLWVLFCRRVVWNTSIMKCVSNAKFRVSLAKSLWVFDIICNTLQHTATARNSLFWIKYFDVEHDASLLRKQVRDSQFFFAAGPRES